MTRPLSLAAALMMTLPLVAVGQNAAQTQRNKPQADGEKHRINFDRSFKEGQRFMLTGRALAAKGQHSSEGGASEQPGRSPNDGAAQNRERGAKQNRAQNNQNRQTQKQNSDRQTPGQNRSAQTANSKSLEIMGELEIVKVDDEGSVAEAKLTVHRFQSQGLDSSSAAPKGNAANRNAAGNQQKRGAQQQSGAQQIQKGTVLICKAGDDGAEITLEKEEKSLSKEMTKMLTAVVPVCDKKKEKEGFSDALGGEEERAEGESWELDEKDFPKAAKKAGLKTATATFIGTKTVHGIKCYAVTVQFAAEKKAGDRDSAAGEREQQRTAKDRTADRKDRSRDAEGSKDVKAVAATAFCLLPAEKDLPALQVGGSITMLKGDSADEKQGQTQTRDRKAPQNQKQTQNQNQNQKQTQQQAQAGNLVRYQFVRDLQPMNGDAKAGSANDSRNDN